MYLQLVDLHVLPAKARWFMVLTMIRYQHPACVNVMKMLLQPEANLIRIHLLGFKYLR